MKTHLLTVALISALLQVAAMAPKAYAEDRTPVMKAITLQIDDMSTPACPALVEAAVSGVQGVDTVEATLKTRTATIRYDARQSSPEDFMAAIKRDVGFTSVIRH